MRLFTDISAGELLSSPDELTLNGSRKQAILANLLISVTFLMFYHFKRVQQQLILCVKFHPSFSWLTRQTNNLQLDDNWL